MVNKKTITVTTMLLVPRGVEHVRFKKSASTRKMAEIWRKHGEHYFFGFSGRRKFYGLWQKEMCFIFVHNDCCWFDL